MVYVNIGWAGHRRDARVDVRTYYRHRVRYADRDRATIDIEIDRIELYQDGYFLGEVTHIPRQLSELEATVYRDGTVNFDRDVFVVGDPAVGFEMISTRYYDDYLLDAYDASQGYRAGVLDLRRSTVQPVRYSRLFDPNDFNGYVPISLLPEDHDWLFDYGFGSVTAHYYGDDDDYYYGDVGAGYRGAEAGNVAPLTDRYEEHYQTKRGADILLQRETEISRLDGR